MEITTELCSKGSPKVTVGIPFYNAEATLADAVRSVFAQTFQDWELILVDDGSTDGSLDIAHRVRDPRVRVLSDGENRQLSYRLNQIATEARAPFLARMDADDLMHPLRLASQVDYMEKHPRIDVLGSAAYLLDGREGVVGVLCNGSHRSSRFRLLLSNFFVHPTVMMKKEWARRNPYYPEFVRAEDAELWSRTFNHSNFKNLAEPLYYYRKESAFSFPKYAMSQRTARKIFRTYGSSLVGSGLTALLLARSLGKSFIFSIGTPLGVHRWMFMFRHLRISGSGKALAEEALTSLKRARVPGLSPAGFITPSVNITLPSPSTQPSCVVRSLPEGVDPGYPGSDDSYSPSQAYPEYPFRDLAKRTNPIYDLIRECLRDAKTDPENAGTARWNPLGSWIKKGQRVFIIPNFVTNRRHDESFLTYTSKCTHASILRALIDYVYLASGNINHITLGNAPLQSCNYERLLDENSICQVLDFYLKAVGAAPKVYDLRLLKARWSWYGALLDRREDCPEDAVSIDLGKDSLLDELFKNRGVQVRVGDYDPLVTMSFHGPGRHVYVVHRRILEADVVLSAPKVKTHKLVGITCALKGTVGAIARKECLAHYRKGGPERGGDEYPRSAYIRDLGSDLVDRGNRGGSGLKDNALRIFSKGVYRCLRQSSDGSMDGAWHGNDTSWRMALDISRILRYARPDGTMSATPQRNHLALVDGIIAGEGEGPLFPKPRPLGVVLFSPDVCAVDAACALVMGFDPERIPLIKNSFSCTPYPLTEFRPYDLSYLHNGQPVTADGLSKCFPSPFVANKGWRGFIEKA